MAREAHAPRMDKAWMEERRLELLEKHRRGEELTHSERLSLALDEVSG